MGRCGKYLDGHSIEFGDAIDSTLNDTWHTWSNQRKAYEKSKVNSVGDFAITNQR